VIAPPGQAQVERSLASYRHEPTAQAALEILGKVGFSVRRAKVPEVFTFYRDAHMIA
jgi:hypothetical protein